MGGKIKFHFKKPKKLPTWQLVLILIPLIFLAATLLRFDHIRMANLRSAVLAADQEGNEDELISSLEELSSFTRKNIVVNVVDSNGDQKITFGTGPFYLEQSYLSAANEALAAAEAKASNSTNPNGNIFAAAMNVCKPQAIANGWTWNSSPYLNCMTSEINKYPAAEDLTSQLIADIPSTELYRKEFISPLWAPSLSGFILLLCLAVSVVIFIRFICWIVIRLSLLFV